MGNTDKLQINIDTLIFGGGVSGLWSHNQLYSNGYKCLLLETDTLGAKQTGYSQGIIHGGIKYALSNKISNSTQTIQAMPQIWQKFINNQGAFKLPELKLITNYQFLLTPKNLSGKFQQFLYNKMLASSCESIKPNQYPSFLQNSKFKYKISKLHENILDIPSLVNSLSQNIKNQYFQYDLKNLIKISKNSEYYQLIFENNSQQTLTINTKAILLCAGSENINLFNKINFDQKLNPPQMQLRPLHMVWVKDKNLPELYLHCMQKTDKPLITISTHKDTPESTPTWYLGGDLAETGTNLDPDSQIIRAQNILETLFPWLNLDKAKWGSLKIDRSEAKQPKNQRPSGANIIQHDNLFTIWPTKLTFAPLIGEQVLEKIQKLFAPNPNSNKFSTQDLKTLTNYFELVKTYRPAWS